MGEAKSYTLIELSHEFGDCIYGKFVLSYENQNDLCNLQYKIFFTEIRISKSSKSLRFCNYNNKNFLQINNVSWIIIDEDIVNIYTIRFGNKEIKIIDSQNDVKTI